MKILLITFAFSFVIFRTSAQEPPANAIEVRLALFQHINANGRNEMALGISIINHSNKNIYIPEFETFASFSGIHFYQLESGNWREIDLFTHDYYYPPIFSKKRLPGEPSDSHGESIAMYFDDNDITRANKKNLLQIQRNQDSLTNKFYGVIGILPLKRFGGYHAPLFLKAGQELKNYSFFDIDYLFKKKADYMVKFNSESRD